jgi:hypothetical protein
VSGANLQFPQKLRAPKEVVQDVMGSSSPGPDADYAGPVIRKIGNPNI